MFEGLHIAGRAELGPLLESFGQANSDFYPVLDLGAERRRYRKDNAAGFPALANEWFNLLASMRGQRSTPVFEPQPALPGNPRVQAGALAAFLRSSVTLDAEIRRMVRLPRRGYQWQLWRTAIQDQTGPPQLGRCG